MRGDHRDLGPWRAEYSRRAALDPLRAVLDAGDVDGTKNAYTDLVEQVHLRGLLRGRRFGLAVDLGCGVGRLTPLLAARSRRVLGLDASPQMLGAASHRRLPANVGFCCSDVRDLPVADGSADLVISSQVLIHLLAPSDLQEVADEMARVVGPRGCVILSEHVSVGQSHARGGIVYRSVEDLVAPFESRGFRAVVNRPVRKMPSLIVHWVRRRYLPRALWWLAAHLEPWHARTIDPLTTYRDQLVVLRREENGAAAR